MGSRTAAATKSSAQQAKKQAKSRQSQPKHRQRPPAGDDDLHDDLNKRVGIDNQSQSIALDAHSIDLTEDATEWRRYSNLSAPDPLPGYRQRWIRARLVSRNDSSNVLKKFREGWRPRKASTLPDGHSLPTIYLDQFGDCIGVEEMILCQMPEKVFLQMQKFYRDRRDQQTASTERELENLGELHQVPIHKRKVTRVGRRPPVSVADD